MELTRRQRSRLDLRYREPASRSGQPARGKARQSSSQTPPSGDQALQLIRHAAGYESVSHLANSDLHRIASGFQKRPYVN